MNLSQMKRQFENDVKEICRQLNNHPIESFVRAFDRLDIFKRYEELYGDGQSELAQKILQNLKDRQKKKARRFILSIRGVWQGMSRRIWVIASSAQLADIRRFQAEKLKDIEEQAGLFDEWQDEIERRTGTTQDRLGAEMSRILNEMRQRLGLNGPNGPALPPSQE